MFPVNKPLPRPPSVAQTDNAPQVNALPTRPTGSLPPIPPNRPANDQPLPSTPLDNESQSFVTHKPQDTQRNAWGGASRREPRKNFAIGNARTQTNATQTDSPTQSIPPTPDRTTKNLSNENIIPLGPPPSINRNTKETPTNSLPPTPDRTTKNISTDSFEIPKESESTPTMPAYLPPYIVMPSTPPPRPSTSSENITPPIVNRNTKETPTNSLPPTPDRTTKNISTDAFEIPKEAAPAMPAYLPPYIVMPSTAPPCPPVSDDENQQTVITNDDESQTVFRGQWNPPVPAPRPVSFMPDNFNLSKAQIEEDEAKRKRQTIDSLRAVYTTGILPPAPTPPPPPEEEDEENYNENNNLVQVYQEDDIPPNYIESLDNNNDVNYENTIDDEEDEPPPYVCIDDIDSDEDALPPSYLNSLRDEQYEEDDELPPAYQIQDADEDEEYDAEELLAIMEAEDDENAGQESLEECKMLVKWGEAGAPPPVPSRDDPSHYLSDENALHFIKQKEEVPDAYDMIKDDPRFERLRLKWCPNIFTKKGAKQFAKNKLDPATLPYVGILFHMNRVRNAVKGHGQVDKILESYGDDQPELKESLETFKGAQKIRGIQETAYTGVAACCMMLPVVDFIPGLSAQLMILGEVGAGAAESGIEMGLKVLISKGTGQLTSCAMPNTEAFGGYGSSKAFLLYIGLPKTDDPLYAKWEPYRLKLKAIYGCAPEDDLMKMRPKGQLLQQIREEESKSGKAYQIEVPLLVLLWRAFECWHTLYWDRIVYAKDTTKSKTRSVLGLRRELTLDERRRMRDYRKLQETEFVIESKSAIDPHLQILKKKKHRKEIIELLSITLLHSYHVAYLFTRKKLRSEQKKNIQWFMKMVVDYFFAHGAFFWGYVGTDDEVKAVAIWDRPNEAAKISFLSMLRTDGTYKLGPNKWKAMSDILFKMEEIRKTDIGGLRCWMLHWIAVHPRYQKQGIGELLVKNTISRHTEPIYVQLFDTETEMATFLNKMCFRPVNHEDARFSLYGQRVSVVAYWFGMQSPTELRALLPAKKKNPLQLTYHTLRKAASIPSIAGRAANQQLRLQNEKVFQQSEENRLYKEAQQRYEETATLLDHLKMDLARLPTADRESNPIAQSLQSKINEYQHLLDIYRNSLEDAKNNAMALKKPLLLTN